MVAGGFAGCSDIEAEFIKAGMNGTEHVGMRGKAEIITAGEVDKFASPMQNMRAVDLPERFAEISRA